MIRQLILAASVIALLTTGVRAADDDLKEIFYAPFEGSPDAVIARGMAEPFQARVDAYVDGVVGKAAASRRRYNGIRYDGRGNIDLDRGTWAFFYKPLYEPGVSAWFPFVSVSTEIEGYWWGIVQFIVREQNFQLHYFDAGRYSPPMFFKPLHKRWKKDEWRHLAIVWDRNEGITLYEDGQRISSNWGRYRWDWTHDPRDLVFGSWIYSTRPFALDEVHIYATPLTDAQIAQLARGKKPTGTPIPITPPDQRRTRDLARMGWSPEDLGEIPTVESGQILRYALARTTHAVDARRRIAQPVDGLWASAWPLTKYGASAKGRLLEIGLAPDQSYDRVRIFMHRTFIGSFQELVPGMGLRKTLDVEAVRPIWRGHFDARRNDRRIYLARQGGWLGQIDFIRAEIVAANTLPKALLSLHTRKIDRLPPTLAGRAALGETPPRFDNPARATREDAAPWTCASPAFGGLQILTETLAEPVAMDGVVVTLAVEDLRGPTAVQIKIKEPVFPQRNWLVADAVLAPKAPGKQTFVIHLTGRPVISYPERELAVLVTAGEPVTWRMGRGGTAIGLCLADLEKAKPSAIEDQIEWAREAYAEINEGHIWDNIGDHGWGILYHPLKWLDEFAPDRRETLQLAGRIGRWRRKPLPWKEPANDTGAPDWAFWQMRAFNECKRIIHWIIDNRQVENGEFGGVWGDDTDMVEYWSDYVLSGDDDGKIAGALRLFWDGVYREALRDGVSRTIRDNLHSYEEGMGCIAHQLLVDYGDPIAIEHTMRAAGHYGKWMARNDDGTYRFLSNYFGYGGVWTEGRFGKDTARNQLMFIPAGYLVWYNRHPTVAKYIQGWTLSRSGPGITADAALRLDGDEAVMRKWYEEQAEKYIKQRRYFHRTNCLLDEVSVKEEWKKPLMSFASTRGFLAGTLPTYAGYSPTMTEAFWMAWKAGGDVKYLTDSYKQACRFINGQDWLYTVAQPSTDRIPLPKTTVIRARLGAFVTERGGHTNTWPRHGISYTRGADDVAALVTENTVKDLKVRLYCFADKEHNLQIRIWKLDPGVQKIALYHDKDNDGKPEAAFHEKEMSLGRGDYIDLKLPPRQGSILHISGVRTHKPVYDLPDPAVASREIYLEYNDHLHVTVHNIGTQPVKDLLVRVIDGHTGTVVAEKTIPRIEAPLDMNPQTTLLEFHNINATTKDSIIVLLDPENRNPDLNRHNNKAVYVY